jgi:hypothetical protein
MHFTPENARAILDGRKTMTRRLVKTGDVELVRPELPGDRVFFHSNTMYVKYPATETREITAVETNGRLKWRVGQTYAVQPGRTKSGVGRIRITDIRQERLQEISEEDAIAEGCKATYFSVSGNITPWNQPDKPILARDRYARLWDSINTRKGIRWEDNQNVWVLTFELVKEPIE